MIRRALDLRPLTALVPAAVRARAREARPLAARALMPAALSTITVFLAIAGASSADEPAPARPATAAAGSAAEVEALEGLPLRFYLAPPDIARLGGRLLGPFDVSPAGTVVLAIEVAGGGRNLVVPEAGLPLLAENDPGLEGFSRLPGGAFVAVRAGRLARLERGRLVEEAALPAAGARIAPGESDDRLYVFGGKGAAATAIHVVLPGRRAARLVEAPAPVSALAEVGGRVYFAAGGAVYGAGGGLPPALVYAPPAGAPEITAIAGDASLRVLYMATAGDVVAVRNGAAARILTGAGGAILFRRGSLFVVDAARGLFIELPGVSRILAGIDAGENAGGAR